MSKKLLSEAQIRRFQGLANITPLQEMDHPAKKDDNEMEEGVYKKEDDLEEGMHEEPKEGMYKEEDYMEEKMDMDDEDMDADDDQVEVEEEMVEKAAAALSDLQALVDALGGAAAPDMDDDAGEDEMPLPDADEPEEKEEDEPAIMEDDSILELALEGIHYEASKKEIVQEVAKRVAKRLMEAKEAQAKLNKALGNK